MIETFRISFRLQITYHTNALLRALKSVPGVKKLLPTALYASKGLKRFALVVSVLREILSIFLGKVLYLLLMVVLPLFYFKLSGPANFLHVLLFLTLLGGLLNARIIQPGRDKYYAVFLMRLDAKKYALSNYLYFLLRTFVGMAVVTAVIGSLYGVSVFGAVTAAALVVAIKCILPAILLGTPMKEQKKRFEKLYTVLAILVITALLFVAYALPVLGWALPVKVFYAVCAVAVIGAVPSVWALYHFKGYKDAYKEEFTGEMAVESPKSATAKALQASYQKKLSFSASQTSKKSGYAYLNDLFVQRHTKILTRSALRITLFFTALMLVGIAACLFYPPVREKLNEYLLTALPSLLFVMYFINRGQTITQAMFVNCDHSMLTYRFYRQPKAILQLFAARLRSVIRINLMPAAVLATGLPIMLLLSGGTAHPLDYFLLFASVLLMAVFFSVHHMVLYYLLQPYNENSETKNPMFTVANAVTYLISYFAIRQEIATSVFGVFLLAFCVLYIAFALLAAYRLAPKTFCLRQ
jgi:hypothetical protein